MPVKVLGLRKLRATFHRVPRSVTHQSQRPVEDGARLVRDEARRLAPFRRGTLARSIRVTKIRANRRLTAAAAARTDVSYAAHVEYGTRHMSARPYLRPAQKNQGVRVVKLLKQQMPGMLNRAVK